MNDLSWFTFILDEKKIFYTDSKVTETGEISVGDLGLRSILGLSDEKDFTVRNSEMMRGILRESRVYYLSDEFFCNYILMKKSTDAVTVIGPYLSGNYSHIDIRKLLKQKHIEAVSLSEVTQYYAALPQIVDNQMWEAVIKACAAERFGTDAFSAKFEFITETKPVRKKEVFQSEHNRTYYEIEERYDNESRLMDAIAAGDLDKARNCLNRVARPTLEKRTGSMVRDIKNMYLVFNTLCRTAVRRSNVHPKIIDQLSREFSIRIEAASNTNMLIGIRKEMMIRYCNAVRSSVPTTNPTIKRVLVHINTNLDQNLTLADTAKQFDISRGYLARAFKEETGESFMTFVSRLRLEKAKELLEQTDYSIHHVAEVCGYMDNNYFSRKFKAACQMTPGEYRRNVRLRNVPGCSR